MQFSVIYSVDVPADESILDFAPPQVKELWHETEDDDQFGFGYLEGCWKGGHHRKWCAILDREQFEKFVEHCGLVADDTETMGSLGAPGCPTGRMERIRHRQYIRGSAALLQKPARKHT